MFNGSLCTARVGKKTAAIIPLIFRRTEQTKSGHETFRRDTQFPGMDLLESEPIFFSKVGNLPIKFRRDKRLCRFRPLYLINIKP